MKQRDDVPAAEDRFFTALLAADGPALESLLTPDFVIIDKRMRWRWPMATAQGTPIAPGGPA